MATSQVRLSRLARQCRYNRSLVSLSLFMGKIIILLLFINILILLLFFYNETLGYFLDIPGHHDINEKVLLTENIKINTYLVFKKELITTTIYQGFDFPLQNCNIKYKIGNSKLRFLRPSFFHQPSRVIDNTCSLNSIIEFRWF